ncbi:protein NDR1-like [Cynara cardunculus var. scolymus]|nr:protein NDR1-like [Cynara cardunculus var. scolymus]
MKGTSCNDLPENFGLWVFLCILVFVPLLVVLLVLYVNPENPSFKVEKFYVPAFDKTSNADPSDTIFFNIKLQNRNKAIGLFHDDPLNLTISYTPIKTDHKFTWQYSVPKFYQGNHHSRRLIDVVQMPAVDGFTWNQTVVADQVGIQPIMNMGFEPVVFFKVDIESKVRFKLIGRSRGKEAVMSVQVPVHSNTGAMFDEEGMEEDEEESGGGLGFEWSGPQSEEEEKKKKKKKGSL